MARTERSLVNRPDPIDETRTMQHKLRMAAFDGVSEADVKSIIAKQVEKAKGGDLKATQFVCDYLLGAKMQVQATQINHFHGDAARPTEEAEELPGEPGSAERIEAMRRRAEKGAGVFDGRMRNESQENIA